MQLRKREKHAAFEISIAVGSGRFEHHSVRHRNGLRARNWYHGTNLLSGHAAWSVQMSTTSHSNRPGNCASNASTSACADARWPPPVSDMRMRMRVGASAPSMLWGNNRRGVCSRR